MTQLTCLMSLPFTLPDQIKRLWVVLSKKILRYRVMMWYQMQLTDPEEAEIIEDSLQGLRLRYPPGDCPICRLNALLKAASDS